MDKIQGKSLAYIKPIECKKCKLYDSCNWYYKVHFEVFGYDEVKPILNL